MSSFKIDPDLCKTFNIALVYLFGSRVKGVAAVDSDLDIALLFRETPQDPLALREIALFSVELRKLFHAKFDVVSLNNAPLLLKYEVVAHGQLLYCDDETERINFEVSVIKEYIDEEPLRNLYNQALYKKIFNKVCE